MKSEYLDRLLNTVKNRKRVAAAKRSKTLAEQQSKKRVSAREYRKAQEQFSDAIRASKSRGLDDTNAFKRAVSECSEAHKVLLKWGEENSHNGSRETGDVQSCEMIEAFTDLHSK